ncbi:MAG: glycosyltransferase 87 family protein [Janthinobacterium lividum]
MRDPRVVVPVLVGVVMALVLVLTRVGVQSWQPGYDLAVYRDGARDLLSGRDLYQRETVRGHWFVYPPFAAVLFLPLLLLPASADLVVWDAVLVGVTVCATITILRAIRAAPLLVGVGTAAVLVSDPFREALVLGQVSPLVVLGLVLGALYGGRGGAVPAALAAAVKVTPVLVVAAVLNRRARRWFAVPVIVVGALTSLVGVLLAPTSARSYFGSLLWDPARVAPARTTSNNSLAGAFAHAGVADASASHLALLCSVPLFVLVVVLARRADWLQRGDRLRFAIVVSLVTCLASPVTWSHHALAAPVGVMVLLAAHRRWVVLAGVAWLLPLLQWGQTLGGVGGVLLAETRPVSLLVLTVLLSQDVLTRERLPTAQLTSG